MSGLETPLSFPVYGVPRVLPSPSHVIFPKSCEVEKTGHSCLHGGPCCRHGSTWEVAESEPTSRLIQSVLCPFHCRTAHRVVAVFITAVSQWCVCAFSHSVWCPAPRGIMFQLREKSASGIFCSNHSGNPVFSVLFTPL